MKLKVITILLFTRCLITEAAFAQANQWTDFVNVFIGTKRMGHTFPGATVPFGMVQLSPQTNIEPFLKDGKYNGKTYEYCAGYQDMDRNIFGFAHTNFSGTGHSDLGDILIMPTSGEIILEPGNQDNHEGYHSQFEKSSEHASPGYYEVTLDKYNIQARLTTTTRVGFHEYTFQDDKANIILDLVYNIYNYEGKNVRTFLRVEDEHTLTGYRITDGWARNRTVYFAIKFSSPIKSYGYKEYNEVPYRGFYRNFDIEHNFPEIFGKNVRTWLKFDLPSDKKLKVKVALSPTSTLAALKNMKIEIPHWDFERVKSQANSFWNTELNKIQAEFLSAEDKKVFYTALYHSFLSPIIYEDVDGSYRGLDQNNYQSDGFVNYTIFSLWDTYRALHPFFNLVQPSRNSDMVKSMMAHQRQSVHHMLPVWSHYANENWCMIGYHGVSVLADAVVKKIGNIDPKEALAACIATSNVKYYGGLESYLTNGYVFEDRSGSSVSKTLEYAYDDYCIAQLAGYTGNEQIQAEYLKRSRNYKNVYDPTVGFMRPRLSDGSFKSPFDPMDTHGQGFIEGNAWNYGLYVPQDPKSMIEMMGGKKVFLRKLDSLFTMTLDDKYFEHTEDITRDGIIGNYVHGNEPGHHIPYLYNWTDEPWKTQERVRMINRTMYKDARDGLCGNDDAGQMSAWYLFTSLGFYPVCPGSTQYAIGSPGVLSAKILMENGKILNIKTVGQSDKNVYVQKVELNGKVYQSRFFDHSQMVNGCDITFYMGSKPNKKYWNPLE